MTSKGITITAEHSNRWTEAMLQEADVDVTMGCSDTCPVIPGRRYMDWRLLDPAGQPLEAVRPVRDEIEGRVRQLLAELGVRVDVRAERHAGFVEPMTGIEPAYSAWEADVLPLNYIGTRQSASPL